MLKLTLPLLAVSACCSCTQPLATSTVAPRADRVVGAWASHTRADVEAALIKKFNRTYFWGSVGLLPRPEIQPGDRPEIFLFEGTYVERKNDQTGASYANVRGTVNMKTKRVQATFDDWEIR